MQWPFKTLALAVTIPTILAILAICSVLWYGCYYRPRQRREHQRDEQQEPNGQEHQQQRLLVEQRILPLIPDDPVVTTAVAESLVDSRTEFRPVQETGLDMEAAEQRHSSERPGAEGRNGCDEDRQDDVLLDVSGNMNMGMSALMSKRSISRSSSVSSLHDRDDEEASPSIHVPKQRA